MRGRVALPLVATAVVGSLALWATDAGGPPARPAVHGPYSTTEVLEYLLFSTGRVVADHPVLGRSVAGAPTRLPAARARAVVESVNDCIHSLDAAAGPALTAAFNAADPRRLDHALRRFDDAAKRWATAPAPGPCPPPPPPPSSPPDNGTAPGWWKVNAYGAWDYVLAGWDFYGGALTLGVVGAIAAALLTAVVLVVFVTLVLVPAFIWYEFQAVPSELDRQIAIAKLVRALRS